MRTELKDIMKLEQERQKQVYTLGIKQLIEDKEFPYLSCNVCGYDCYVSGTNEQKKNLFLLFKFLKTLITRAFTY